MKTSVENYLKLIWCFLLMGEINITYETLFDMVRNEKKREELQKLDKDFFTDLVSYIKEKKELVSKKTDSDLFSSVEHEKSRKQLENIKALTKELYERREKKIVNMALISSRTGSIMDMSALLEPEKELFENLTEVLSEYRTSVLLKLMKAQVPGSVQVKDECKRTTRLVRFLQPVPKFLGEEEQIYGPFEKEDIANLPENIAELLINKGRAEEIKG